jgi:SAM-dependent methyltransferase
MDSDNLAAVQSSYDALAAEYARRIYDELAGKPLDRELLDHFATRLKGVGKVCDLGCGPGHVASYLHQRGVDVVGIDLSPSMVDQARQLNPDLDFRQGNMLALDASDHSFAAIVSFYSIIHIPRAELPGLFRELHRVLQPNGLLFLAFHVGLDEQHVQELWGVKTDLHFYFLHRREIEQHLRTAGFFVEDSLERQPYPEVEVPTRRAYLLARKNVPG